MRPLDLNEILAGSESIAGHFDNSATIPHELFKTRACPPSA
jgi:hypothetical protein